MRIVVTGANRGIGLELVRQLRARGDEVIAGCREPSAATELARTGASVHALDVASDASVAAFAKAITGAIDVVFNVAGIYGSDPRMGSFEFSEAQQVFDVNALGPLRVVQALLPAVRSGTGKKLVHVTSGMGSIGDNQAGGSYGYRMSKAALNMASRCLAIELRPEGISSYVINPGWVQTDMGGSSAPTPVADSAAGIIRTVDAATLTDSGEFLNWKGDRYPW